MILANLRACLSADYPEYYAMFNEREFTWEKIRQPNRNPDPRPGFRRRRRP